MLIGMLGWFPPTQYLGWFIDIEGKFIAPIIRTVFENQKTSLDLMEERAFKNINNCLNINVYSYLETSGGRISDLYLNVVHFFNTRVN
jgi:hypothetical protein